MDQIIADMSSQLSLLRECLDQQQRYESPERHQRNIQTIKYKGIPLIPVSLVAQELLCAEIELKVAQARYNETMRSVDNVQQARRLVEDLDIQNDRLARLHKITEASPLWTISYWDPFRLAAQITRIHVSLVSSLVPLIHLIPGTPGGPIQSMNHFHDFLKRVLTTELLALEKDQGV